MSDPIPAQPETPLVARADFQYRWRVYVFFIMVFGYGLWSARDGFIKWPEGQRINEEHVARGEKPTETEHNQASILINQILGVVLPAVSLPLFVWLMYRSRGSYRLEANVLRLPGKEPIPLGKIQAMDKSLWDKKGIAVLEYQDAAGQTQTATLRDMVYERRTTDRIVERIEKALGSASTGSEAAASEG